MSFVYYLEKNAEFIKKKESEDERNEWKTFVRITIVYTR